MNIFCTCAAGIPYESKSMTLNTDKSSSGRTFTLSAYRLFPLSFSFSIPRYSSTLLNLDHISFAPAKQSNTRRAFRSLVACSLICIFADISPLSTYLVWYPPLVRRRMIDIHTELLYLLYNLFDFCNRFRIRNIYLDKPETFFERPCFLLLGGLNLFVLFV